MSELSVFIDESGDYGTNSAFYLLTFVFHEQRNGISTEIAKLSDKLNNMGFPREKAIHSGPIIRKEDEYQNMALDDRKRLLTAMCGFSRSCDIRYKTFCLNKREYPDEIKLKNRLARETSLFFQENLAYFTSFDKVIVYYDNGQAIVTNIVNAVFGAIFFDAEIRRVIPSDYRLFQCADLFCTLELLRRKDEMSLPMTRSEEIFFESRRRLRKDYLKTIDKLRFENRR